MYLNKTDNGFLVDGGQCGSQDVGNVDPRT